jgi:hypothetical protein
VEELDPFKSRPVGPPAAKFNNPGDFIAGKILKVEYRADTDQATGKVKTFSNGEPRPVVIVYLQTADGEEMRDFVKGRSVTTFRQRVWAVEGEDHGPKPGADYKRTFTGLRGGGPEKEYRIEYSNSTDTRELV